MGEKLKPLSRSENGKFGTLKSDSTHHFFRNACTKSGSLQFSVFRLLTDFVCLYNYELLLSLCKIVRSSIILLLPLFVDISRIVYHYCLSFLFLSTFYKKCFKIPVRLSEDVNGKKRCDSQT